MDSDEISLDIIKTYIINENPDSIINTNSDSIINTNSDVPINNIINELKIIKNNKLYELEQIMPHEEAYEDESIQQIDEYISYINNELRKLATNATTPINTYTNATTGGKKTRRSNKKRSNKKRSNKKRSNKKRSNKRR